ncbi:hypothetical protein COJ01_18025 [Priestia megaterium]|uniref:hypothetical protein n=1 Tax=Priestia megaterium TaxID=1404 RepID=UPI000BF94B40|nr:hypothetical protein [Priestia megaterium]PFK99943.1 hypothetical protein COJ01_18025 [Priestia megaterium]
MSAFIHVPTLLLDIESIRYIVSDQSININVDAIANNLGISKDDPALVKHCIDAIESVTHMDIWDDNGVFSIMDNDIWDEERLVNIENHLISKKIPFDSIQGNEMILYKYRPEISEELFSQLEHPDIEGPVISAEFILNIIELTSTNDLDTFKKILLKNIEEGINLVPHIRSYATESNKNFQATGLMDLRLLA